MGDPQQPFPRESLRGLIVSISQRVSVPPPTSRKSWELSYGRPLCPFKRKLLPCALGWSAGTSSWISGLELPRILGFQQVRGPLPIRPYTVLKRTLTGSDIGREDILSPGVITFDPAPG